MPAFISKSVRGDNVKEDMKSNEKKTEKSQKSKKSFSIKSNKSRDYDSLVNSKVKSSNLNVFGSFNK